SSRSRPATTVAAVCRWAASDPLRKASSRGLWVLVPCSARPCGLDRGHRHMTDNEQEHPGGDDTQPEPTAEQLAEMDSYQLVRLGTNLDGVQIEEYPDPWPVKGTKAEKRAERLISTWFVVAATA